MFLLHELETVLTEEAVFSMCERTAIMKLRLHSHVHASNDVLVWLDGRER